MSHVLLVCRDRELGATIQNRLEEELGGGEYRIMVDLARNEADANSRLNALNYDLLVTEAELPADRSTPLDPAAHRGLALVKAGRPAGLPAVVLATSVGGDLLYEIQRLSRCYLVLQGEARWDERLLQSCTEALQPSRPIQAPAQERYLAEAEIVVNLAQEPWTYKLKGSGFPYEAIGSLQIDQGVMNELKGLSENIGKLSDKDEWEGQLRTVGKRLMEQIFKNNAVFNSQFSKLVGMVGGEQNVKIEFVVEKAIQGVALESVLEVEGEDYWMLQAPVYRKFRKHEAYPLFAADAGPPQPLHCLIIEANVNGDVDVHGDKVHLPEMTNVHAEAEGLRGYLEQNRTRFNIDRIEHVKESTGGLTFLDTIGKAAQGQRWDIVHYAGHSYYDKSHGGFVFFPAKFTEVVNVELFSMKLQRPRFVYLSSCRSSLAPFVFTLAEKNAGAILGFRWDIDDLDAAEHAKAFYKALFEEEHNLEYAFLKVRQLMHHQHPEKKIWAAPILMM